jgi:hypothetical protein
MEMGKWWIFNHPFEKLFSDDRSDDIDDSILDKNE